MNSFYSFTHDCLLNPDDILGYDAIVDAKFIELKLYVKIVIYTDQA